MVAGTVFAEAVVAVAVEKSVAGIVVAVGGTVTLAAAEIVAYQ